MPRNMETTGTVLGSVSDSQVNIPMYGSRPQAGFASVGDEHIERVLDINDLVIKHPASTFFVRVEGDSMEGAGIYSGDVLVVDKAIAPKDGHIVVGAVLGELLVKRLRARSTTFELHSENERYAPIVVSEQDDCHIWGVVVGSVRVFV
ncbi:MAG TPA: translesion error-prone DNA polymerase V autoproteolytic subunit [Candidatus Paceibacterota bacterium]|nr:translesion error-prone DNA polymerase V autoproteolytic subunit [Candidatus Paceibacterota bacterium]